MTTANTHFIDLGSTTIHAREWTGQKRTFVLVHGLSSNARTWDLLAELLASAGHHVLTIDQRGHGLSDKPEEGYDFATVTADLARLIEVEQLDQPILVGQSWGGNVMLEFGARYPDLAHGLAFIDGGFLDLQARPKATWEAVSEELKPPNWENMPRTRLHQLISNANPEWAEAGVEGTLHNFETLPDGKVRPWLTWSRHRQILWAMWQQRPQELYPRVTTPVLICVAVDPTNADFTAQKGKLVEAAQTGLPRVEVHWFENTAHDIHVHRPKRLADLLLTTLNDGLWRQERSM